MRLCYQLCGSFELCVSREIIGSNEVCSKIQFFAVSFKHLMYTVLIPTEVIIDAWHSIVQAQRGSTSTIDKVKKVVHPSEYLLLLRGNQSMKRKNALFISL
jgi:hypothetical protein